MEFIDESQKITDEKPQKLNLDKRQVAYLFNLKKKLEDGVNVRIIPKTRQALKQLFGLDADVYKINPTDNLRFKKNKNPLEKEVGELNEDDGSPIMSDKPNETPIPNIKPNETPSIKPTINPTDMLRINSKKSDENDLLNKLVEEYVKSKNEIDTKPKEIIVIHKHYYYDALAQKANTKLDEKVDDEDEDEVDDENEDEVDEVDNENDLLDDKITNKYSDKIMELIEERLKAKNLQKDLLTKPLIKPYFKFL